MKDDKTKITKETERRLASSGKVKTQNLTVSLYKGDMELMEWLVEFLGSTRSDAVRTAIRSLASNLKAIEKGSRRT